jgi:hypothetical protein
MGAPQDEQLDEDSLGKIVIQVVDITTGKPVNEVFTVNFFNSLEPNNNSSLEWFEKTNDKGHLVTKLKPGMYYMQFLPESSLSNYELEPSPILSDENMQIVTVESHKITEVLKKANYGGKLKIVLVDPEGRKINPDVDFFTNAGVRASLYSKGVLGLLQNEHKSVSSLTGVKNDLSDGEALVGRLYPGTYNIKVGFGFLGIKGQEIKGIQIFRNQTTTCEVVINIDTSTGIEGYIKDQNGTPLFDLRVKINDAKTRTDKNGYYRILGMDEGRRLLHVHSDMLADSDIFINKSFYVDIKKNTIVQKNIVFEIK